MNNILKQSQGQSPPIALSVPDRAWHTMTPNEVESHFGTDSSTGLDEATVQQRLAQFGPNRLAEARQQTIWQVFLEEIREPLLTTVYNCAQIKLTTPRYGGSLWEMLLSIPTGDGHDQEQDREVRRIGAG